MIRRPETGSKMNAGEKNRLNSIFSAAPLQRVKRTSSVAKKANTNQTASEVWCSMGPLSAISSKRLLNVMIKKN